MPKLSEFLYIPATFASLMCLKALDQMYKTFIGLQFRLIVISVPNLLSSHDAKSCSTFVIPFLRLSVTQGRKSLSYSKNTITARLYLHAVTF